jgi:hypothetical protein
MKTKLLLMILMLVTSSIYSQKTTTKTKWRSTETDTLAVAQAMFDDQNFVMAYPYLNQLQKNHPEEPFLKYLTGISALFKGDTHEQGLTFLLDVYADNKRAEDIEFYVALAYHYNNNFAEAIKMVDKYLSKKALTKPQRRSAEKLKDYCQRGEILVAAPDEGTLDDYISVLEEE